jgi:hypothetical protein
LVTVVWAVAVACSGPATPSGGVAVRSGEWSGVTSQGTPIAFTVSSNETVTSITVSYRFNGCSGSKAFTNLNLPTRPEVICVPAPCTGSIASFRRLSFSDRSAENGSRTTISGLFLPGDRAEGQVQFADYPECGSTASAPWTAVRR